MTEKPPTWEAYTAMQFKLEREVAALKQDLNKWKYHANNPTHREQELFDKSLFVAAEKILMLENRVEELEKQLNETK